LAVHLSLRLIPQVAPLEARLDVGECKNVQIAAAGMRHADGAPYVIIVAVIGGARRSARAWVDR
jgi:hypothetical protein